MMGEVRRGGDAMWWNLEAWGRWIGGVGEASVSDRGGMGVGRVDFSQKGAMSPHVTGAGKEYLNLSILPQ